jgi:hypothetical protein
MIDKFDSKGTMHHQRGKDPAHKIKAHLVMDGNL